MWGLCVSGQHVINFFYLVGVSGSAKQLKNLAQNITAFEEEIRVLDFVLHLNYYYFVLLDCFPLFLHFLTSLIKSALWHSRKRLKLFYKQEVGRGREGSVPGKAPQCPDYSSKKKQPSNKKIKNTENERCWQKCGEIGTHLVV